MLGHAYTAQKRYPEAVTQLAKATELSHGNSEALGSMAYAYCLAGDAERAAKKLDDLTSPSNGRYVSPYSLALVYHAMGKSEQALATLQRACEERDVRLPMLKVDGRWSSFQSDPRFEAILTRINLR